MKCSSAGRENFRVDGRPLPIKMGSRTPSFHGRRENLRWSTWPDGQPVDLLACHFEFSPTQQDRLSTEARHETLYRPVSRRGSTPALPCLHPELRRLFQIGLGVGCHLMGFGRNAW